MPGCTINQRVAFQSLIRFVRKVKNYGNAFSKSSRIYFSIIPLMDIYILLHVLLILFSIIYTCNIIIHLMARDATKPVFGLISAFVIRWLERIVSTLSTSKISLLLLVSVADETSLSLFLSENPKTGFVAARPK